MTQVEGSGSGRDVEGGLSQIFVMSSPFFISYAIIERMDMFLVSVYFKNLR